MTPSPPRSRANSNHQEVPLDGRGEGGGSDIHADHDVKNGNGKRRLDGKGKLWREDEGEVARLMRTVDFAARVSLMIH